MRRAARPARKEGRAIGGARDAPSSRPVGREVRLPVHAERGCVPAMLAAMDTACLEHRLTDEERRHFDERGYLIVRNVLPPDLVAELTEAADRVDAEFRPKYGLKPSQPLNRASISSATTPLSSNCSNGRRPSPVSSTSWAGTSSSTTATSSSHRRWRRTMCRPLGSAGTRTADGSTSTSSPSRAPASRSKWGSSSPARWSRIGATSMSCPEATAPTRLSFRTRAKNTQTPRPYWQTPAMPCSSTAASGTRPAATAPT